MKCGRCGRILPPGSVFCPGCGSRVGSGYHGVPKDYARDVIRPSSGRSGGSYSYRPDKKNATHSIRDSAPRQSSSGSYPPKSGYTGYQGYQGYQSRPQTTGSTAPKKSSSSSPERSGAFWLVILVLVGIFLLWGRAGSTRGEKRVSSSTQVTERASTRDPIFKTEIPETTAVPETTSIPETTSVPETQPVRYADEILLDARGVGNCSAMTGTIGILYIFMDDAESAWTQQEINTYLAEADPLIKMLEEDARKWGVPLTFRQYYEHHSVSANVDISTMVVYHETCVNATGRQMETANQSIAEQTGTDQAFMVFAFNKNGRSAAHQSASCECCFVFSGTGSLRHEIAHLFGAADFYNTDYMREQSQLYLPNSVMNDPGEGRVDELTAYLLGWTDTITPSARSYLDSISWMTQEDLTEGSQQNTITGYGTFRTDGSRYEGELFYGFPHGHGTYYWDNGDTFEGDFDNGTQVGQGIYTWADGSRFEGGFSNFIPHGYGVYSWPSGDSFVGTFENGVQTGQGVFTWADGTRYEGEMVNLVPQGYGTTTWTNGYSQTGYWNNGQFVG